MSAGRAVVFDFDGTVLDTEAASHQAWREAYVAHGAVLADHEFALCIGTHHGFDLYGALVERADRPVPPETELRAAKSARALELLLPERPRPGVVEWLAEARRAGAALAIASSSERDWVESHLARLGLRHHFDVLACWDGTCAAKPAPDLFVRACEALGVAPDRSVAVEDSPNGVEAAVAAGLFCVAVPHALTAALDLSRAHVVATSLAELDLGDVLARSARG